MKKIKIIVLLVILILNCTGCNFQFYSSEETGFKTVDIISNGTIQVPEDWVYSEVDSNIYFGDKSISEDDVTVYLFQSEITDNDNLKKHTKPNIMCDSFIDDEIISSNSLSNSTMYGYRMFSIDGYKQKLLYLDLINTRFFVWGNNVDEKLLVKIAKSYKPYPDVEKYGF